METKWPFMIIAFGLVFLLGLVISGLERKNVMKNWDKRRCELAVMAAAGFFKDMSDPRTKTQFAKDNFDFCMGSFVDSFLNKLMKPVGAMFEKQVNLTDSSLGMLNSIRTINQTLYNTLSSYLEQFYRRFNNSVFEISRITQYFRMAMQRMNAMAVSMIYSGISMFRGMLNSIQLVIKVILIICGIMIAIIIVLWFVLFPFIPLIISTLGAIVTTVFALTMVISATVADQAENSKGPFCFTKDTMIPLEKDGKEIFVSINHVKIGDKLVDGGIITAIIEMDGMNIPLYDVEGVFVSGSHLIKGTDGEWKAVADDERAIVTNKMVDILYCLNTTTHNIPIKSNKGMIYFRDWEEFAEEDTRGHYTWNYEVLKELNKYVSYDKWKKSLTISTEVPLLSENSKVKTSDGYQLLSSITIGNEKIMDKNGKEQKVLGKVKGELEGVKGKDGWHTELFEWIDDVWIKGSSTVKEGKEKMIGENIITESGEFIIWDDDNKVDKVIRDFTDIGYKAIYKTYPLVGARLRIYE